jgi:hypothetical protein
MWVGGWLNSNFKGGTNNGGWSVDFIVKKPFDFSELTKYINVAFGADSR